MKISEYVDDYSKYYWSLVQDNRTMFKATQGGIDGFIIDIAPSDRELFPEIPKIAKSMFLWKDEDDLVWCVANNRRACQ